MGTESEGALRELASRLGNLEYAVRNVSDAVKALAQAQALQTPGGFGGQGGGALVFAAIGVAAIAGGGGSGAGTLASTGGAVTIVNGWTLSAAAGLRCAVQARSDGDYDLMILDCTTGS
jgi:hypothetical protein